MPKATFMPVPKQHYDSAIGNPLVGGKLYTFAAGTSTPKATYSDPDSTTPQQNPIPLNARGEPDQAIFWDGNYRVELRDFVGNLIYSVDNFNTDPFGIVDKIAELFSSAGSSIVGYIQDGIGAVRRTVESRLRDTVSIKDFGAKGDGLNDDSDAAQKATNTGRAVYFPAGVYKISGVTYTGRTCWYSHGDVTIMSDSDVLIVTNGSYSRIDNLRLVNITAPWIIRRNKLTWATEFGPAQSNDEGYQPTVSDFDVWPTLNTAQQTQDIGPKIVFTGNASGIEVSKISGEFVSILLYDAQYSSVHDCNFRAGKNFAGGIVFWNINAQVGYSNAAFDNFIRYPSFSGVVMSRNYDGTMSRNRVDGGGESGIKTYQNEVGGVDARCYRMQVQDNNVTFMYFDSLDLASDYPITGTKDSRHTVTGNNCFGSRQTGLHIDGLLCMISSNNLRGHFQDGIKAILQNSKVSENMISDNNRFASVSGVHHITVEGSGNSISGNRIRTAGNPGAGIYAPGSNYATGNMCNDGAFFWGNVGSITSYLASNADMLPTMQNTVPMRIKQLATELPALELFSELTAVNSVAMQFHPRHEQLRNPIAEAIGIVTQGEDNQEYGWLSLRAASNGTLYDGMHIMNHVSVPGKSWPALMTPNAVIDPGVLPNGSSAFYLDEANNSLKIAVRYSNGAVKTGSINLT